MGGSGSGGNIETLYALVHIFVLVAAVLLVGTGVVVVLVLNDFLLGSLCTN